MRIALLIAAALQLACAGAHAERALAVYCSVDDVWSAPLFAQFSKATGIAVKPVYDTEANKSIGLATRILAERAQPACDVYWGCEPVQMQRLAEAGMFVPCSNLPLRLPSVLSNWPSALYLPNSFRQRVIVVNTNMVRNAAQYPTSVLDLTNGQWRGMAGLANPQFGSTALELAVLCQEMAPARFGTWYAQTKANNIRVFQGNSHAAQAVAKGTHAWALTDNDDARHEIAKGAPMVMVGEHLYFPYGLCVVAKPGIKTNEVVAFVEYMMGPDVERALCGKPPFNYTVNEVLSRGKFRITLDKLTESHQRMSELVRGQ